MPGKSDQIATCCPCHLRRSIDDVFTYAETAELLKVHPRTVRNWANEGLLERTDLVNTQNPRIIGASIQNVIEDGRLRERNDR